MNKIEQLIKENIVSEARRNPEKNPFISINDLYRKYHEDKNVFISFVENMGYFDSSNVKQTKIGINPKSRYDTPNGIYTYPLYRMWSDIRKEVQIPFAGDRPFVYFIKPIGNHIEDINNMNISQAKEYTDRLVRYFVELLNDKTVDSHFLKQNIVEVASLTARVKNTGGEFWAIVRAFAGLYEYSKKSKYPVEKTKFAMREYRLQYSPNVFNLLFSKVCGIDSICDLGGGIIHRNEPVQCVFFNTRAFKVLDVHENSDKNKFNPRSAFNILMKKSDNISQKQINHMESVIATDAYYSIQYAVYVVGEFPLGEYAISKDQDISMDYAGNILVDEEKIKRFVYKYNIPWDWTDKYWDKDQI
jgi:hypothetical protein